MSCPQLNSKNNGLGLLFMTILFCFLSFIAVVGKDGNELRLEKAVLTFSSFDAISTKNIKTLVMGCSFLNHFIRYSPHWLSEFTFCA